ncbi:imidazoleglycerol-phosphate dehydratase [Candidatus Omnitrophus magneticus]|uniref:Imidazoleglycerol-phosphate dehydratase n=1 Tax=Candidatus Omnitrophus magneticus TaxID=1609969 RepID=A0A0F0CN75_9BACT|nr:imidazoleglycerol-phosphate dehydratase [Candidatus Omnitrophus magneticus]
MLSLFAKHSMFDLKINAIGDTEIDYHHLIEDTGIVFGLALKEALGNKEGIARYGASIVPMDEALAEVILDLSGRPFLVYRVEKTEGFFIKDLPVSLFEDFFQALTNHSMMSLHIIVRYGRDLHHIYEAIFKAFARALSIAVTKNDRIKGVLSTKGTL